LRCMSSVPHLLQLNENDGGYILSESHNHVV
jgi:hypothetical protein